jgi:hypothetical protein
MNIADRTARFAARREHQLAAAQLAKRATRALNKKLESAKIRGKVPRPLPPAIVLDILREAYQFQLDWREAKTTMAVSRALREQSEGWIDWRSGHFLILLRAAFPELDAKKCSKWAAALDAADYYQVVPNRLGAFLDKVGGVEGAARRRASLWRTVEDGAWAERSLPQRRFKRIPPAPRGR